MGTASPSLGKLLTLAANIPLHFPTRQWHWSEWLFSPTVSKWWNLEVVTQNSNLKYFKFYCFALVITVPSLFILSLLHKYRNMRCQSVGELNFAQSECDRFWTITNLLTKQMCVAECMCFEGWLDSLIRLGIFWIDFVHSIIFSKEWLIKICYFEACIRMLKSTETIVIV